MSPNEKSSVLERRLQSVLCMLIVMLAAWAGTSLNSLQTEAAKTSEQVASIKEDIAELKERGMEAYPKSDARREWGEHERDFRILADRVRKIELTGY